MLLELSLYVDAPSGPLGGGARQDASDGEDEVFRVEDAPVMPLSLSCSTGCAEAVRFALDPVGGEDRAAAPAEWPRAHDLVPWGGSAVSRIGGRRAMRCTMSRQPSARHSSSPVARRRTVGCWSLPFSMKTWPWPSCCVRAGKLTRAQLSTYYAAKMRGSKKAKLLAETTVAHHHAMLKTVYNWALEEELLLVNPALRVKNPPALRPKTRPVWGMGEIASTVIKARGLQVHAAGVLAGFSGLRVGEIAGLLWSDLDLERGFVTVSRTVEEDDDGTLLEYPPKNGKARVVPLPAAACDELRVWLAAQKEYRLAQGPAWNEAGRVVPKKDGTQMAPSTLKSQWWNWVARQKIDPHLPIHGLRDSFGTWVYETYGVKQAQEWLGHSDPATTLRHYVRLTTAARAKAVAGLDEVTRAALESAEEKVLEDDQPLLDNVVSLAGRRR